MDITYALKNSGIAVGLLASAVVMAQQETVKGTVVDEQGFPVIGAVVQVKGTSTGTATDIDGNYVINANPDDILVISYIGMKTREMSPSEAKIVTLSEESQNLEEVVVVAYGTAKKNTFTGALAVVDNERLNTAQVSNVSTALQGAAAGVQVTTASGQPGAAATVRIRGVGSINASSSPLYVVDGIPFDGDLSSINPSDIESMVVLKDAASAALYGSRAGNGVVMITTKTGSKDQKPKVNIRATYGMTSRAVNELELLGTDQWAELRWEALRNGFMDNGVTAEEAAKRASAGLIDDMGINPWGSKFPQPVGLDGKLDPNAKLLWDDNWGDEMIGRGARAEINANISGGSKNTQYFLSAGHLDEKGITLGSGFQRTSVRTNLTNQTFSWLKSTLNLGYSHSTTDFNDSQDSNVGNALSYGMNVPSFYPIYKRNPETGAYLYDSQGKKIFDYGPYRTNSFATNNQIASLPLSKNQTKRDLISVRGSLDFDLGKIYQPLEGLAFKTQYSTDISLSHNHTYNPAFKTLETVGEDGQYEVGQDLQNTSASRYDATVKSYTFNNILSYRKDINEDHSIGLMAGHEMYGYDYTYNGGSTQSFPLPGIQEPDAGSTVTKYSAYSDRFTLLGLLGRAEYTYQQRYNVSASFRRDGSSKFSKENRWSNFWSVGTAWNIEREVFMQDVSWVNHLKLRASYGAQGNQELSSYYPSQEIYEPGQIGNSPGIYIKDLSNTDLTWETNLNTNIGIDFVLLNNRLSGTFEYFQRQSKDLLYGLDLPSSSGYSYVLSNVGAMRNNGFEFELKGSLVQNKNIGVDLGINLSHYRNKITAFPVEDGIQSGTKFLKEGSDIYAFNLVEWAGNTTSQEPLYDRNGAGQIVEVRKAIGGEPSWYLVGDDGKKYRTTQYATASSSDRQNMGSAIPDLYGGVNLDVRLWDFTISAMMAYSIGGKLYSADYLGNYNSGTSKGRPLASAMINRWTPENPNSDLPRLSTSDLNYTYSSQSSAHLHNASYARLKNLAVTYNLPQKALKKLHMSNGSVFVQGENLFTLFGQDGIDPESGGINGVTSFRYPAVKTVSFGVNLTF